MTRGWRLLLGGIVAALVGMASGGAFRQESTIDAAPFPRIDDAPRSGDSGPAIWAEPVRNDGCGGVYR